MEGRTGADEGEQPHEGTGEYTPVLGSPVGRDDKHGNEAGTRELARTKLPAPEPLTNDAGTHSRPPPWLDQ